MMIRRLLLGTLAAVALYFFVGGAVANQVLAEMDVSGLDDWVAYARSNPADCAQVEAQPGVSSPAQNPAAADPSISPAESAVLAFLRSRHTGLSRHDESNVARTVVREARRHGFDPSLVLAVIQVESGGYNLAVSHVGAMGLMQLLPSTAEEIARRHDLDWRGEDSLFDPVLNVTLGTAYIKRLTDRYGDVTTALAAYNWGPGRIDRRIRKGSELPSIYTDRIMKALEVASAEREARPAQS